MPFFPLTVTLFKLFITRIQKIFLKGNPLLTNALLRKISKSTLFSFERHNLICYENFKYVYNMLNILHTNNK